MSSDDDDDSVTLLDSPVAEPKRRRTDSATSRDKTAVEELREVIGYQPLYILKRLLDENNGSLEAAANAFYERGVAAAASAPAVSIPFTKAGSKIKEEKFALTPQVKKENSISVRAVSLPVRTSSVPRRSPLSVKPELSPIALRKRADTNIDYGDKGSDIDDDEEEKESSTVITPARLTRSRSQSSPTVKAPPTTDSKSSKGDDGGDDVPMSEDSWDVSDDESEASSHEKDSDDDSAGSDDDDEAINPRRRRMNFWRQQRARVTVVPTKLKGSRKGKAVPIIDTTRNKKSNGKGAGKGGIVKGVKGKGKINAKASKKRKKLSSSSSDSDSSSSSDSDGSDIQRPQESSLPPHKRISTYREEMRVDACINGYWFPASVVFVSSDGLQSVYQCQRLVTAVSTSHRSGQR